MPSLRASFERDGYVVIPGLVDAELLAELRSVAVQALDPLAAPVEYEADVGYPGAPAHRGAAGGHAPRRLLYAYARHEVFRRWAAGAVLAKELALVSGARDWQLSQCHHNCVMTKTPGYSSETHWHQDIRYWSFDEPELISVWLALGPETMENGALQLIPGSHGMTLDRGRLDRDLFLRQDLAVNQSLLADAVAVALEPGDVLLFHCRTFHAAGRNQTKETKLSLVFTYHRAGNKPIPGTRSSAFPSIPVAL